MRDDSFGKSDRRRPSIVSSPARRSALYTGVIIFLALLVTIVFAPLSATSGDSCTGGEVSNCMSVERYILIFVPSLLLLVGGVVAFVKSYSVWRGGGPWKVWHASGWVLFVMMMVFLSVSGASLIS